MREQFLYEPLSHLFIHIDKLDSHLDAMGRIGLLTHNAPIHRQLRAPGTMESHCDGLRRGKQWLLQIHGDSMLSDVPRPHSDCRLPYRDLAQESSIHAEQTSPLRTFVGRKDRDG